MRTFVLQIANLCYGVHSGAGAIANGGFLAGRRAASSGLGGGMRWMVLWDSGWVETRGVGGSASETGGFLTHDLNTVVAAAAAGFIR